MTNNPSYDWLGTGWLVRENIVVTNRHVASAFATRNPGGGFMFLRNFRRRLMAASIDFRMEHDSDAIEEYPLVEVLDIEEPDPSPDIAFLRVSVAGGSPGARWGGRSLCRASSRSRDRKSRSSATPAGQPDPRPRRCPIDLQRRLRHQVAWPLARSCGSSRTSWNTTLRRWAETLARR